MMKKGIGAVAVAAFLLAGWARGGSDDTNPTPPQVRLELDLQDGSYVIGTPRIESVPLQTTYARMNVTLRQILGITVGADHETATVDLRNGDKLTGVLSLEPIELVTLVGPVKIGIQHIRRIKVVLSGGSLSDLLKQGLLLRYSFDRETGDKVVDASGNGRDARVAGARWTPNGKAGGGCEVGRNLGHLETPDQDAWSFPRKDFGICLWLQVKAVPGGEQMIVAHDDGGGERNKWAFEFLNGNIDFHVNTTRSESYRIASRRWQPEPGKWYHLAVTRKANTYTIYVDGAVVSTEDNALPLPAANAPLTIGQGEGLYVDGVLDELLIFDRALSQEEIRAIVDAAR